MQDQSTPTELGLKFVCLSKKELPSGSHVMTPIPNMLIGHLCLQALIRAGCVESRVNKCLVFARRIGSVDPWEFHIAYIPWYVAFHPMNSYEELLVSGDEDLLHFNAIVYKIVIDSPNTHHFTLDDAKLNKFRVEWGDALVSLLLDPLNEFAEFLEYTHLRSLFKEWVDNGIISMLLGPLIEIVEDLNANPKVHPTIAHAMIKLVNSQTQTMVPYAEAIVYFGDLFRVYGIDMELHVDCF